MMGKSWYQAHEVADHMPFTVRKNKAVNPGVPLACLFTWHKTRPPGLATFRWILLCKALLGV